MTALIVLLLTPILTAAALKVYDDFRKALRVIAEVSER